MALWEFIVIIGIGFIILELFTPSMFFLNFAFAAFITAIVSLFTAKMITLVLVFFILSFLSFAFLRPIILNKFRKETETGINDKYIGKRAKDIEDVNEDLTVKKTPASSVSNEEEEVSDVVIHSKKIPKSIPICYGKNKIRIGSSC